MVEISFFAGAIGALGGAIAVIALRNPFYSVLALVVHLVSLAGLFLLLHAEFVAAAQIVVYAGAVMVLYVFVAAYVGGFEEPLWEPIPGQRILAPLLAAALFVELSIAVLGTGADVDRHRGPDDPGRASARPAAIGKLLLERFLIAVRGRLAAAADRRRRRGRPRRPHAPTPRARRAARRRPRWTSPGTSSSRALLFAIGAGGVLMRRSPLVILLCLELMLNAGNLALVAFSRSTRQRRRPGLRADRDGRRRLRGRRRARADRRHVPAPDAARRRRDPGAARVSGDHLGLARPRLPARGLHRDRARAAQVAAGAGRRLDRHGRRSRSPSPARSARCSRCSTTRPTSASSPTRSTTTPRAAGLDIQLGILVDPLSVFMCLVVTGVSTLIHLYSLAYMDSDRGYARFFSLPQLLRLLDAAAGPRRQLRAADRRLGVRRLRLLRADQLLVPARDRDQGRA